MAAIFAAASHALLASVVFAFETTRQPMGLLPLLAGCSASYLVMLLLMRNSIMTEKLARRGTSVRTDYALDALSQVLVRSVMSTDPITLDADLPLDYVRRWLDSGAGGTHHHGFPVTTGDEYVIGVVTRRDLLGGEDGEARVRDIVKRNAAVIYVDSTLREAADHMIREKVGRLAVVTRENPTQLVGIVTRSDLLAGHAQRLHGLDHAERVIASGTAEDDRGS